MSTAEPAAHCRELFDSLDKVESILSKSRFLAGNQLTEADVRLFMTLIRFDEVGHSGWLPLIQALFGWTMSSMLAQFRRRKWVCSQTVSAFDCCMTPLLPCLQVYVVYFKTSEHLMLSLLLCCIAVECLGHALQQL